MAQCTAIRPSPADFGDPTVFRAAVAVHFAGFLRKRARSPRIERVHRRRRQTMAGVPVTAEMRIFGQTLPLIPDGPAFARKNDVFRQTAIRHLADRQSAAHSASDGNGVTAHDARFVETLTALPMEQVIPSADSQQIPGTLAFARHRIKCLRSGTPSDRFHTERRLEIIGARRVPPAAVKGHGATDVDRRRIARGFAGKFQSAASGAAVDFGPRAFARILSLA